MQCEGEISKGLPVGASAILGELKANTGCQFSWMLCWRNVWKVPVQVELCRWEALEVVSGSGIHKELSR